MTKILVYNTKELFDEYTQIISKLRDFNSVVQNNMIIDHEETINFFINFDNAIEELRAWKVKVRNVFQDNFISDEEGFILSNILIENFGKIPEIDNIHTTIGLYLNGDYVVNGVSSEDLNDHINYNIKYRFGRALFVDGECIHKGYFDNQLSRLEEFAEKFKSIKVYKKSIEYK